jgi:hypothetical protein
MKMVICLQISTVFYRWKHYFSQLLIVHFINAVRETDLQTTEPLESVASPLERRLHNEEFHNLYASPNIISDRINDDEMVGTCSTHGRDEMHTRLWPENLKGRHYLEDLNVDRRITLEWMIRKRDGNLWMAYICIRTGISFGFW